VSQDVGLHFWLRYAEREGALIDDAGASALLVLPRPLRERFHLAEEVAVTSDPDLAREDGALLLIPGHPVLDAAAAQVLYEGDAGLVWLAWPAKPPPQRGALLAAARDQVAVEHGRIDVDGEAVPRYAPVLRVGAQVTHLVNEHFYEREEVWVDACTALPLSGELERRLQELPRLEGKPAHSRLEPDLSLAVGAAHVLLEERAGARLRTLAKQSEAALRDELALAEAYYTALLDSIADRQKAAPPERQAVFEAQAQATRVERKRRQHEIEEKFQARHQIRPIRLHLVLVPALRLPVVIRRGERSYPFALTWWLPTSRFADTRCPACTAPAPLVAGKERLGCQRCLRRPVQEPARPEPPPRAASIPAPPPLEPRKAPAPPRRARPSPQRVGRVGPARQRAAAQVPDLPAGAAEEVRQLREFEELRQRVIRVGNKLAGDFWQAMVDLDPWPRKRADPHSPLRVLYHLYGADGPLRGVGIPVGALPTKSSFFTQEPVPGFLYCTSGTVFAGGRAYPYALLWRLAAGKPVVEEVLPFPASPNGRFWLRWNLPSWSSSALYEGAPPPRIELDPVAANLWRIELPESGLPLVVRCLASWWRIAHAPELAAVPPPVLAAALTALLGRRAGLNRTQKAAAADYGAEPAEVLGAARQLQHLLRLSEGRRS
jgi:hypothetical protein